jgi:hypothetical protein
MPGSSILLALVAIGSVSLAAAPLSFNREVRPILSDKCFACHGPDASTREAKLRLDVRESALDRGVIVPGDPEASELIHRILADDADEIMPPPESHKTLMPAEKDLLKRWIAEGAGFEPHWAYVPPQRHPLPGEGTADWPANWIDRFILTRLDAEQLAPSPDADPVTLVRRLHFDLTGLPPSPEDVDSFVQAAAADLADAIGVRARQLLASPAFGERMAIYWLDLVRYADTVGYHGDQDHNISPYRDYVIDAFNANMPFDRFTREQLAGDLLENPTKWQKIATGYNRLLQTSHEGGIQQKEYDAIYAADRVRNLSVVWMGATVGCAQCHDHKFDPYTMKDHYSLAAFFADLHDDGFTGNTLPTKRPPEMLVFAPEDEQHVAGLDAQLDSIAGENRGELEGLLDRETQLERAVEAAKDDEKKTEREQELAEVRTGIGELVTDEERKRFEGLRSERRKVEKRGRPTMITEAHEPREMRILPRGNWLDDSGAAVQPSFPEFLVSRDEEPTIQNDGKRLTRLDLANWLTEAGDGVGGLTARVFVNRLWYLFFGTGIAKDLGDFGGQGQPPVHPELLDNLAMELIESGWDVKHMVELMVTSRAYRQSSLAPPALRERDPQNQLVARQSRFRLPAEMIRDNALAVSGLLVATRGGPSVKPYQPGGYYRHLNFPKREYASHDDDRQWRRGVYVHWQRQFLHPMLKAFDAPTREECAAERPRSNTPLAAMTLLNDPTFVEAARVFASRILRDGGATDRERLDYAYRLAVSRRAEPDEWELMRELLGFARRDFGAHPGAAEELLSTGQAPVADVLDPNEHAAWTTVARAVLNLSETSTRN